MSSVTGTTRGRQAAEALGGAQDKLAIATMELEKAQNRLSQTQSAINIGRATLNGTMQQGIDLLRRDGQEVGVVAGMYDRLGKMLNFATVEQEKFNAASLKIERPKGVQDYLDNLSTQVELQGELNERKRAQLKAEQEIRKLGGDENDVRLARDRAAAEYDNVEAQKAQKKASDEAASAGKRSATQAESVADKLANLKRQSELASESTQQLSREQAMLRAEQSLGSSASAAQITEARNYAAATWDAGNALRAQAAAEKLIPETRENTSYEQDVRDLNTALSAKKITQEQFNQASEQLERTHQTNLAKIRSEQAVTPLQDAAGSVDPVQKLANENARKLMLIQQFEQQGVLSHENALALRAAADTEYEQARIAAQWELFRNQSLSNELLASSLDGLQSGASSALTGLINGTQSLQEAFANIGSTILNSVVSALVEMGIQWVKSQLMGQAANQAAIVSNQAMATAALAASTAMEGCTMIIYVNKGDYRSYGFTPDLWGGDTTPVEVPDDFSGGGKTYDPESGSWITDPPYEPTEEDIAREHETRRNELLAESAAITADWRAEASIDEISDEDRVKLKTWLAYNKALKATAVGEEWPPVPET